MNIWFLVEGECAILSQNMPSFLILFFGFSIAVTAVWLKHHLFVLPDDWLFISFPLLTYGFFVSLFALWLWFQKRTLSFQMPRFLIAGIVFALAIGIFNLQTFFAGLILPGHAPILPFTSWATANLSFATKLGTIALTFILLTAIFAATGNLILKRFQSDQSSDGYWFFIRLAVGASIWVSFLIVLSGLGIFSQAAIGLAAILIAIYERRYLFTLIRWCDVQDHWLINVKNPTFLLIALGLFLLALNIGEAVRPAPVGYDDMTAYMNRVNLMTEARALIPGGNPFPFELLATGIRIASGDETMMLAMSLGVYGLFLGIALLYAFGQSIFSSRTGLIAALIVLSIPMGPALAIAEVKPDALLFPIATLFFWSLFATIQTKDLRYSFFAIFLFGFALSIKLTAFLLILPLILTFGILLYTQKSLLSPLSLRHSVAAGIFFLLPLLPWIWYGMSTRTAADPIHLTSSPIQLLSSVNHPATPSLDQEINDELRGTACQATGALEDFERFTSARSTLGQYFFLPWDLTLNLAVTAFAAEIGFLFLAILPLWLIRTRSLTGSPLRTFLEKPTIILAIFALGYFFLWLILAEQIPWYGYPGLALLALLTAIAIERFRSPIFLGWFLFALLLVGLIGNTLVRMKFSAAPERLQYAAGTITADEFLDTTFPGLYTLKSAVNENSNIRIYITGSRLWYAIEHNTERAYMDSHLDTFNCLLEKHGEQGTLEILQTLRIRYIFFSRVLLSELENDERPTFQSKVRRFTDFADESLRILWGSADYTLFEVPAARK